MQNTVQNLVHFKSFLNTCLAGVLCPLDPQLGEISQLVLSNATLVRG